MRSDADIRHDFQRNLKAVMAKRGFPRKRLAREAAVSNTAVDGYVNGHSLPTVVPLVRMADAMGVSVDDLVMPNGEE
jgi:transcriptional regulator with XRE-family HTH domain